MAKRIVGLWLFLFSLVLVTTEALAEEVDISAAASLKEVITELSQRFAQKNPSATFRSSFGASGALARQIESGLPADIFISANEEWVAALKKKKLVEAGTVRTFTYNTLVFAGAAGNKASGMHDLVKLDKIAVGSPKSVPAGEYAVAALKRSGMERQVAGKLVMTKDARDCLMYAERGEVDGAFVYRTDALQAKRAKILFTVPQDLYPRVTYPMGMTESGAKKKDAAAFFTYLQSSEAKAILTKYGFSLK